VNCLHPVNRVNQPNRVNPVNRANLAGSRNILKRSSSGTLARGGTSFASGMTAPFE